MNHLQQIIAFLCTRYPHKSELSKARLTKLVYLADWFSALVDNHSITNINWVFNHYGPYVDDVIDAASKSHNFKISREQTTYGSDKFLVTFEGGFDAPDLTEREKEILEAVINKTSPMYFNDFINYVYSTYPVVSNNRYSNLNLVHLANEYRSTQGQA